jgi:hypothetical protein
MDVSSVISTRPRPDTEMSPRKTPPRYKRTKSLEERRERKRANQRKYRETHAEQIKAYRQRTRDAAKERMGRFMFKNAEKQKEYFREYAKKNRERVRARNRLKLYGVTVEQWDAIFVAQGYKCAICGALEPGGKLGWSGDHCHATNKFRGILCRVCNVMLGHARDDIAILDKAIAYLRNPPFNVHSPSTAPPPAMRSGPCLK